jgi:hypothetical protein
MKGFRRRIQIVWLPVSLAFAQGPVTETARVELAQAAVTAVFAQLQFRVGPISARACGASIRRHHGF